MICEKCGIAYDGNLCPNGCNSPAAKKQKKPIYKKWWFWVILVAVFLIAVSSGENTQQPPATTDSPNSTVTGTPTETTQASDPYYHPGDVISANGLDITYVSAEKWEDYNQYFAPDEGYMYIRLFLSAENTSNTDRFISSAEFSCYADGVSVDAYYMGDDTLSTTNLSSGRKVEGYIYFTVPANAATIEVEYETSFWTGEKAILKVELS